MITVSQVIKVSLANELCPAGCLGSAANTAESASRFFSLPVLCSNLVNGISACLFMALFSCQKADTLTALADLFQSAEKGTYTFN